MINVLRIARILLPIAVIAGAPCGARAEVARVEIAARTDVLGGKPFGDAGPYEKIVGKVFFAVDPNHPANKQIADIDKAPRDAAGRVLFSADLYALMPKDAARGNGAALLDVLNRGRKNMLVAFNRAPPRADPTTEADFGDGFLMRRGFTLIWLGWQFDIPTRDGLMGLDAPAISDNGRPVTGQVTTSFVVNASSPTHALNDLARYADTTHYPPVTGTDTNVLTVRDGFLATPRQIPSDQWQFGRLVDGRVVPDPIALVLNGGFEPGRVYELTYAAQGATVPGLGFAALRDFASALKRPQQGLPGSVRYVYAYGPSQDGRLLREFLYEGFNADEAGARAFDGVMAHIAGAARGSDFNARFARPNGLGFFVATLFPYLDLDQRDPVTGKTDGLQARLSNDQRPKIFYTNSSTEYWGGGRAAALTHTSLDGRDDASVPDNVRIYLFAGTQHVPGGFLPSQGPGQQQANPNEYTWGQRALLVALDRWVRDGVAPPASRHPRLADETLVPQQKLDFPGLPGVRSPTTIPGPYRADLPGLPAEHPLPFLVPNVDRDGNETAGIRLPEIAAPLATYTGWNFRSPAIGQPGELLPLTGSYVPFAVTRAAREQTGDPRLSLEERYGGRAAYLARVTEATSKLATEGFMLDEDRAAVTARAMARWDAATRGTPLAGK